MEVDNFDLISTLLRFDNPDDCYYLEILLRGKDGNDVKKKHNNGDRTIREILIHSMDQFLIQKEEIIKLCREFNARAYIRLNRRSYRGIGFYYVKNFLTEEELSVHNRSMYVPAHRNPFRAMSTACGKVNAEPKMTRSWLIDLDDCQIGDPIVTAFESVIKRPGMNAVISPDDMVISRIPSKSGVHLIVHPFNMSEYKSGSDEGSFTMTVGNYSASVHKDNPTILYAYINETQPKDRI